jgi:hypothetical protein
MSKNAIFQLKEMNPNYYLIFTVEKVLQGEIDDVIDNYLKANILKKDKKIKIVDEARIFCSLLGNYKQLLCWGALPLFPGEGKTLPESATLELYGAKNDIIAPFSAFSDKELKVKTFFHSFSLFQEIESHTRKMRN